MSQGVVEGEPVTFVRQPQGEGTLFVVGTPIGNLDDISVRALRTLREADLILCEDTRVTGRLLSHFGIRAALRRADEHSLAERIAPALSRIERGEKVAFVSDAGMPGVSDPGQRLVDAVLDAGLAVEVIPGPSAVTCALVASGLPMEHFFFEGFLPRKRGALLTRLEELAAVPGALVIYESPHRVPATLAAIADVLPGRQVALARELTKLHEEVVRGPVREVADELIAREDLKGECVIVIAAPSADELTSLRRKRQADVPLNEAVREGLVAGEPKSALAKRLSKAYGVSRAKVYGLALRTSGGCCGQEKSAASTGT